LRARRRVVRLALGCAPIVALLAVGATLAVSDLIVLALVLLVTELIAIHLLDLW
jgi:hypothetical protein